MHQFHRLMLLLNYAAADAADAAAAAAAPTRTPLLCSLLLYSAVDVRLQLDRMTTKMFWLPLHLTTRTTSTHSQSVTSQTEWLT